MVIVVWCGVVVKCNINDNNTRPLTGYDSIALLQLAAGCRKAYGSHFPQGDPNYLYKYTTPQGWGLADVMNWLIPYAHVPPAPWPFNQMVPFDRSTYTMLFRMAANAPAWYNM